jgi:multisubunit Na+/H+ antiporter MnhG subunit
MIDLLRNKKIDLLPQCITEKQSADTGMAMVLICLLISFFGNIKTASAIAIVLLILNMTLPKIFVPLAKIWIGFAIIVGNVVSRILLTLVFYVLVTPVGLIRRVLGADAMQLKKWKKGNASVFRERNHLFNSADIEKPY